MSKDIEDRQRELDLQLVKDAVKTLDKYFDTVQIFCSRHISNETHFVQDGVGNWYARYGQIGVWLKVEESKEVERLIEDRDEDSA